MSTVPPERTGGELAFEDELRSILIRWHIARPVTDVQKEIWICFLEGVAEKVIAGAQTFANCRISEINDRIKRWNKEHKKKGMKVGEATNVRIAGLLGVVDGTVSRWLNEPSSGVGLSSFCQLLYVIGRFVHQIPPQDADEVLWAGLKRAMQSLIAQFDGVDPALDSDPDESVITAIRSGRFEAVAPAYVDAYFAALCAVEMSDSIEAGFD